MDDASVLNWLQNAFDNLDISAVGDGLVLEGYEPADEIQAMGVNVAVFNHGGTVSVQVSGFGDVEVVWQGPEASWAASTDEAARTAASLVTELLAQYT